MMRMTLWRTRKSKLMMNREKQAVGEASRIYLAACGGVVDMYSLLGCLHNRAFSPVDSAALRVPAQFGVGGRHWLSLHDVKLFFWIVFSVFVCFGIFEC
ncbi:hypothetical protein F5Y14DRAFT_398771 [Nemania sp. NC0429]|nr:hypothetical protein F5Y14DRAFT_398771 [Nemania sp. NC0429]